MVSLRELGARVARARLRLPVVPTQAQAGELVGRSRRWWQQLEAGEIDPQLGDVERVAGLLGMQLSELLGVEVAQVEELRRQRRMSVSPEEDETKRRTFIMGAAASLATGGINSALWRGSGDATQADILGVADHEFIERTYLFTGLA